MVNERVQSALRLLYRKPHMVQRKKATAKYAVPSKQNISIESVDFKVPHTAKSKQAWKYQGGTIIRHPSKMINGTPYTDPKDPDSARRKQESNFFITINTNMVATDEDINAYDDMARVLRLLETEEYIATYIKFGPKDHEYQNDKYNDVIASVNWKAAVEQGDVMRRVHAHIWLTITHYSQIQINVPVLMHLFKKLYNDPKDLGNRSRIKKMPYVHVKLLPQSDWTDVMRQYIHKAMTQA